MSPKQLMREIVKGAAFATAAALLAPVNVLFLLRGVLPAVVAIGVVQLILLVIGIFIMFSANRRAKE